MDLADGRMIPVAPPVYDESALKHPNVEFPDETDQASLKNYVVSYAYFVSDFSAADDPVFEPESEYCWRDTGVACSTYEAGTCVPNVVETNTAYRLHDYSLPAELTS